MEENKVSLSYEIKDIDLDIEISLIPKEPVLKYKIIIKNSLNHPANIESMRAKIQVLGIMDTYQVKDIIIPANDTLEIDVEKKLGNLIDFGNGVLNYFVKPNEKSKYKIRGLAKIDGEFYRIKGTSKK